MVPLRSSHMKAINVQKIAKALDKLFAMWHEETLVGLVSSGRTTRGGVNGLDVAWYRSRYR